MAVAITRRDVLVGDLRRQAGRTRDAKAARRMLAIARVVEGQSREDAAEACGIAETQSVCGWDRQTLRDWVHRFNADGLAGLADRPRQNGPEPRLSPEQDAVVAGWVEQGPDLARDGVVRWRCVDLQDRIKREWGISLHERTIGKLLRRLAFRRLSVRPQHPKSDPVAQAVFRTGSRALQPPACPRPPRTSPSRSGSWTRPPAANAPRFGESASSPKRRSRLRLGTLTRVWAPRGTRPRALRDHRRSSACLFGAVCPERGTGAAVVLPHVNVEAMNVHLAEISRHVTEGAHAVLVLDQAGPRKCLRHFAGTPRPSCMGRSRANRNAISPTSACCRCRPTPRN